ncbi:unnamed protein product [Penicillium salamii]|uniref:Zn(2)-C6 fungal-type domain-containing protein n=1 Tax=Penicillium salamii TaxID=1612424 RepID=A0A9W4NAN3_9EURO|nr:unnamed protein product [Penicillium salamii]CAG8117865.1 unnamed protein product [Penicillium salamii]CAG8294865.1 unnamed protein product [Penicillium salamii]CAG8346123.1 unnamed protein product [Penicillium salamii]CAG8348083.1 unnamed protein product [Penicillium salamii]
MDTKTKIRPQQSCLKCRERKVKCDRSIPCHACILRGLAAECTYTATAEDRAHISQADIIEQLRKEVSQLRGRLNQPREPARPQKSWRSHPYAPRKQKEREGSWSGSSSTMTVNVTSPDSTGSDNGASVSSRSASVSAQNTSVSVPYSADARDLDGRAYCLLWGFGALLILIELPFEYPDVNPMQVHGLANAPVYDMPLEEPTYYSNINYTPVPVPVPPPVPPPAPALAPPPPPAQTQTHYAHYPDQLSNENEMWKGYGSTPMAPPAPYTSQYSSIDTFANANANATVYPDALGDTASRASSSSLSPTIMNSIPSSWRGEGKKAVLEALLETIGSCDEHQVAQVIHVVRTSPTPEDAVSGICQVLGLGTGW